MKHLKLHIGVAFGIALTPVLLYLSLPVIGLLGVQFLSVYSFPVQGFEEPFWSYDAATGNLPTPVGVFTSMVIYLNLYLLLVFGGKALLKNLGSKK